MSDLHEIDVTIDATGNVRLAVRGVKGNACRQLTEKLEKLLGGQVVARELTPEHDETPIDAGDAERQKIGR